MSSVIPPSVRVVLAAASSFLVLAVASAALAQPIRRKGLARGLNYRRRIAIEALRVPLRVIE